MNFIGDLTNLASVVETGDVGAIWTAWKKVDDDVRNLGDAVFGHQTMQSAAEASGCDHAAVKKCCDDLKIKVQIKLAKRGTTAGGADEVGKIGDGKLLQLILANLPAILALFGL